MIEPHELGTDEQAARRVLVRARGIAPCLDSLTGEARKDAIAILLGVMAELPDAGARRARSLSRNGTAISYADVDSAFSRDDVASLRSLCDAAGDASRAGTPAGSFPEAGMVAQVWPEGRYS